MRAVYINPGHTTRCFEEGVLVRQWVYAGREYVAIRFADGVTCETLKENVEILG